MVFLVGLALSLWLHIHVVVSESAPNDPHVHHNCSISVDEDCEGAGEIDREVDRNLITRAALYVLRCHNQRVFPKYTSVRINNQIPLGRGLGSSGAAVVAGVLLGNEAGGLGLTKDRMLDFCLMIERHPDNVVCQSPQNASREPLKLESFLVSFTLSTY